MSSEVSASPQAFVDTYIRQCADGGDSHVRHKLARRLSLATAARCDELLDVLQTQCDTLDDAPQGRLPVVADDDLAALLEPLARRFYPADSQQSAEAFPPQTVQRIERLYRSLHSDYLSRGQLLRALAASGDEPSLETFARLNVEDPIADPHWCDLAFTPLFQKPQYAAGGLFPQLLEALQHSHLAVHVLDLANHVTQRGMLSPHPATARKNHLADLLSGLINHLQQLEARPNDYAATPEELAQRVGDSVSLVVALCHAMALIGDESLAPKLRQALELSHRRLKTEAAAALARLRDDAGIEGLVEMAEDPVARGRAIAYLEELGLEDKVDPENRSPAALAEGEFAAWLAEPNRFGLAPHLVELIDTREQFWPGFTEPVECYLFRYQYRLPSGKLSGIGLAGPTLHCFMADLEDLPVSDIYAAYAGWCAQHESIQETDCGAFSYEQLQTADRLAGELRELGYEKVQVEKLGQFFGGEMSVATATMENQAGVAICEGSQVHWFPDSPAGRPLGSDLVYHLFKGRKLLEAFNPQ